MPFFLFGMLHVVGVLALAFGLFFLLLWCVRTLTPAQLKQWALWLLLGGFLLCMVAIVGYHLNPRNDAWKSQRGEHNVFMQRMMDVRGDDSFPPDGTGVHVASGSAMMMRGGTGMMGATMGGMVSQLQGKTGDAFDAAFLQEMILHHQGAVDMAKMAQQVAKHPELKTMADGIIAAQQKEIGQMRQWQGSWGY